MLPTLFVLLSLSCFPLHSSHIDVAIFSDESHKSPFSLREGFGEVVAISVKTIDTPLTKLGFYFKNHDATHELEFAVTFDDHINVKVTRLKGTNITSTDLRKLFRMVYIDPESETGRGLKRDVYYNTFILSELSFTFGDDLDKKLETLIRQIKAGDYKKHDAFRARLAQSVGKY